MNYVLRLIVAFSSISSISLHAAYLREQTEVQLLHECKSFESRLLPLLTKTDLENAIFLMDDDLFKSNGAVNNADLHLVFIKFFLLLVGSDAYAAEAVQHRLEVLRGMHDKKEQKEMIRLIRQLDALLYKPNIKRLKPKMQNFYNSVLIEMLALLCTDDFKHIARFKPDMFKFLPKQINLIFISQIAMKIKLPVIFDEVRAAIKQLYFHYNPDETMDSLHNAISSEQRALKADFEKSLRFKTLEIYDKEERTFGILATNFEKLLKGLCYNQLETIMFVVTAPNLTTRDKVVAVAAKIASLVPFEAAEFSDRQKVKHMIQFALSKGTWEQDSKLINKCMLSIEELIKARGATTQSAKALLEFCDTFKDKQASPKEKRQRDERLELASFMPPIDGKSILEQLDALIALEDSGALKESIEKVNRGQRIEFLFLAFKALKDRSIRLTEEQQLLTLNTQHIQALEGAIKEQADADEVLDKEYKQHKEELKSQIAGLINLDESTDL